MYGRKLGGLVDKRTLQTILDHPVSNEEYGEIRKGEPVKDRDVTAHIRELSQKTGIKTSQTKSYAVFPENSYEGDEAKYSTWVDYTDLGLLEIDESKACETLKAEGLVHHGPIKSKDPLITVLDTVLTVFRYTRLIYPILENTDSKELVNGANILAKNNQRNTGKKLPSLDIDKLLLGFDAIWDNGFKDGITEEFKEDLTIEVVKELFSDAIELLRKKPEQTLDMIFTHTIVFHLIYAIRKIEKREGIKILKGNSELMKILNMPSSTYYRKLNRIESSFLMISP
jgi:hypothetical protein